MKKNRSFLSKLGRVERITQDGKLEKRWGMNMSPRISAPELYYTRYTIDTTWLTWRAPRLRA